MSLGYPYESKHSYPVAWANAGDREASDYEERPTQGVEDWSKQDSEEYWKMLEEADINDLIF